MGRNSRLLLSTRDPYWKVHNLLRHITRVFTYFVFSRQDPAASLDFSLHSNDLRPPALPPFSPVFVVTLSSTSRRPLNLFQRFCFLKGRNGIGRDDGEATLNTSGRVL
jgi:hypothetical protein